MSTHTVISATEYLNRSNTGITIDLRTRVERNNEHLKDTQHTPVQEITEDALSHAPKGSHVYLLCQSGKRAFQAADKLDDVDHCELIIIEGGLNALKTEGANTVVAEKPVMSLERQVRVAAGSLVVLGVVLGSTVNSGFFGLSAFVGAGLVFAGITDTCGMGMLLARMPWNTRQH